MVCLAVLEAFGTAWKVSGQVQLLKSEIVGSLRTGYSDWLCANCSMTILIGGVLANQQHGRSGSDDGLHSVLSFPVLMFWITGTRLAPPDVKETYFISSKRRSYTLPCSWQ